MNPNQPNRTPKNLIFHGGLLFGLALLFIWGLYLQKGEGASPALQIVLPQDETPAPEDLQPEEPREWAEISAANAPDAGAAVNTAPASGVWIEMKTVGVVLSGANEYAVILSTSDPEPRLLPAFVNYAEATAIHMELNRTRSPRPLTHELAQNALAAIGGRIARVELTEVKDGNLLGTLYLEKGGRALAPISEARPGDLVALALGAQIPIYVSAAVVSEFAVTAGEVNPERSAPESRPEGSL